MKMWRKIAIIEKKSKIFERILSFALVDDAKYVLPMA